MSKFTRTTFTGTTTVEDERVRDDQSAGARRIAAELLQHGLTIDDLSKLDCPVKLRDADDYDEMIAAVREQVAQMAQIPVAHYHPQARHFTCFTRGY